MISADALPDGRPGSYDDSRKTTEALYRTGAFSLPMTTDRVELSLPLVTARTKQVAYFHRDTGTLARRSNVAGTGKARTKVIVAFRQTAVKVLRSTEMRFRRRTFLQRFWMADSAVSIFEKSDVRLKSIRRGSEKCEIGGRVK